jgi:O-antigen/teichoic acid export membrane protein
MDNSNFKKMIKAHHLNFLTIFITFLKRCASVIRLQGFDVATPAGRSQERYRRVALTALASGGAKMVSCLTMLVSIPLSLSYLGVERYGMWMTISSVVLMMGFADLGMGNGLMNVIAETHGRDDRQAAIHYVSSTFFMLTGVALLILVAFALTYPVIPWPAVFNVHSSLAGREAGPATAAFLACFLLNLPLGVVQRVQWGYQEGFINSLWETLGRVVGLAGLLMVIYCKASLVWLVLAMSGAPVLTSLLNGAALFGSRRPWLRPHWQYCLATYTRTIFKVGLVFFSLQMAVTLIYLSDNVIIAHLLGAEAVAQYSVPSRMFSLTVVLMNMVIAPLWPAYGEAMARGDLAWVKKTLNRYFLLSFLLVGVPSFLMVIFGKQLLWLWVGPTISPSYWLLGGLGLWSIILCFGSVMSVLLNAAGVFRFQIIFCFLTLFISLIAKIFLSPIFGLPGIIWGSIFAYSIFFLVPYKIYIRNKYFKTIDLIC